MPQPASVLEMVKVRYSALQPATSPAVAPVDCCPPKTAWSMGWGQISREECHDLTPGNSDASLEGLSVFIANWYKVCAGPSNLTK